MSARPWTVRRVLAWIIAAFAVIVPSAVWGVATASTEASLGPHLARYEVTIGQQVVVDLGPLGTLVIDSPVWGLGAHVVVQEIPREVTSVGAAATLDALGRDLESYVQFFTGPQETLDGVIRALVADAVRRTVIAVVVLVAGIGVVRLVLGRDRRSELAGLLVAHRGVVAGGVVGVLLVGGTATASVPQRSVEDVSQAASSVFDGTPLEGARITGRLAGVIDTYGGMVVDTYRGNEDFYTAAVTNLETAWQARVAPAVDADDRDADDEGTGDGTEDFQVTAPEPVVLLVVSDLHCNVGMARVVRKAAELAGAQVILNAGDTTVNGTAVESYCVQAVADAVPPGAVQVVADGNHDSAETSAQERAAGATVLDGQVVDVHGIRILGDSDPNATRIGSGTSLVGEETVTEAAERLAQIACTEQPDLLLVHDPRVGDAALDRRCVPAQISGHWHRRVGPTLEGDSVRYVSSSTAGATLGQATIGPLNGVAELTLLYFDPASRRIVDYRVLRVHPDTRVSVGFALDWPVRKPPPPPPWAPV